MTQRLLPRLWHIRWHIDHDLAMVVQPLRELPKACGQFFAALAVRATVVRPLAYRGSHSAI
jgi:hypothetical protein